VDSHTAAAGGGKSSATPGCVAGTRPKRAVLAAITLDDGSAVALRRADAIALALGAALHVIHVVPRTRIDTLVPSVSASLSAEAPAHGVAPARSMPRQPARGVPAAGA
jgi:nucleotide-binding universal stress UspA family protein